MKLENPPRNACNWPNNWEEEKDDNATALFDTMFRLMKTNYKILIKDDSPIKDSPPDSEFIDTEFFKIFELDEGRKIFLDACSPACIDQNKQMDTILKELTEPRLDPKTDFGPNCGFCAPASLDDDVSEHFVLSEFLKTCDNKADLDSWQALTSPKTNEEKTKVLPCQHTESLGFVDQISQHFRAEPQKGSLKKELDGTQNQRPEAHLQFQDSFQPRPVTDVPSIRPEQIVQVRPCKNISAIGQNLSELQNITKDNASSPHAQYASQSHCTGEPELPKVGLAQDTQNPQVNHMFVFFNAEKTHFSHNRYRSKLHQDGDKALSCHSKNIKSKSHLDTSNWVQNSTPMWEQLRESSLNFPVKIEGGDDKRQLDNKLMMKSSNSKLETEPHNQESSNYQTMHSDYSETSSEVNPKALVLTSHQNQNTGHNLVTEIGMSSPTSSSHSYSKPVPTPRLLLSTYHTPGPSNYSIQKEKSMTSSPGCFISESEISTPLSLTHQTLNQEHLPVSEPEMAARCLQPARKTEGTSMSPNHFSICDPEMNTRSPLTYQTPSPSHCISSKTATTCNSPSYPGSEVTCRSRLNSSSPTAVDPELTSKSLLATFYQALSHSDYHSDDGRPRSIGSLDSVQSPSFSELEMDAVDLEDLDPLDESAFSPLAPSEWLLEESADSSETPGFALPPMIPGTRRFDDGNTGSKVQFKLQYNQILEAASGLYPVRDNQAVMQMEHEFLETLPAGENPITIKDSELPSEYHQINQSRLEVENKQEVLECKWAWCGMECVGQEALVRHIETCHVEPKKADQFTCLWESCLRQARPFNARYKLLIHMRVHSGEKPNKCPMRAMSKDKKRDYGAKNSSKKKMKREETSDKINM